jgi:hypothetical protein
MLVFVTLRPLENDGLPLWDGGFVARPGVRSVAVGVLQCIAGAATLASVGWGLKDQGLYCVAAMLAALVAARRLADDKAPHSGSISSNSERGNARRVSRSA